MNVQLIPTEEEMYRAFVERDASYEGIFYTAVKTTGIFCRPSCPARKPLRENIEFFRTPQEAIQQGYRPCRRCTPLQRDGETPPVIEELFSVIENQPDQPLNDPDLRARGLDPTWVRRWFKTNYGMTFHAYHRAYRLGQALHQLTNGSDVTSTAFENGYESLSGFQEAIRQFTGRTPTENRDTVVVTLHRVLTPLGPLLAGTTPEGVCLLEFMNRRMLKTQLIRLEDRLNCTFVPGSSPMQDRLTAELEAYFSGSLRTFTVPLIISGNTFQEKVWKALGDVPYGTTQSYGALARRIGDPKAVRAVARANGDNRIAILIPCHRIIGADGSLTGYGGGLWRKRWLLLHEGAPFKDAQAQTELPFS